MGASPLGRTLVIANPAASSGKGAGAAGFVRRFLESYPAATEGHELVLTQAPLDAVRLARESDGFDTVIALGGDGVIHEVVNGLMQRDEGSRPALAIIPMGSGNDYARTLGMAINNPSEALAQLVRGVLKRVEVGRVNGHYFMETLSFGIDAAVAIDTTDRRAHDTHAEGEHLFMTSGLRVFSRGCKGWRCTVSFDGETPLTFQDVMFAIQVGPTYGGGFRVCPEADPSDGLLDTCYSVKTPSAAWLLALLGAAKFGRHVSSSCVELRRFSHAEISFDEQPPCQVDGERLDDTRFVVDVIPNALNVVVPRA